MQSYIQLFDGQKSVYILSFEVEVFHDKAVGKSYVNPFKAYRSFDFFLQINNELVFDEILDGRKP